MRPPTRTPPPHVVLVTGLPGTGKTTLAERVAPPLGAPVLGWDWARLIATREGRTSVVVVLLAGIALTGFTSAMTGLLIFVSSDQELRDFTFWMLGSLGGPPSITAALALPFALGPALGSLRGARGVR